MQQGLHHLQVHVLSSDMQGCCALQHGAMKDSIAVDAVAHASQGKLCSETKKVQKDYRFEIKTRTCYKQHKPSQVKGGQSRKA